MKKFFESLLICMRTLRWLLIGPVTGKINKAWILYRHCGLRACWYHVKNKFYRFRLPYDPNAYQLSPSQSRYLLGKCISQPLISIVVPVYKVDRKWLGKCIDSVINQHYDNWELILVDDASQQDDIKELMEDWQNRDKRIRAFFLEQNSGIAKATNKGLRQTQGQFIGFLDHDDELTPDALTWMVWTLNERPDTLWLYSDEDIIAESGKCYNPHFKPDFSPEFLLACMYTCHFSVYSAEILAAVGGIRPGFDGSQDHDLALRFSDVVPQDRVVHIPRVLYHWRAISTSAAAGIAAKPKAPIAGQKAVADTLRRRNIKGSVRSHIQCPTVYEIEFAPSAFPKVDIIIPTKNALALLRTCIESIYQHTQYGNFEITVIDNASDDADTLAYLASESTAGKLKVLRYDKPFNHSDMNNVAIAGSDAEFTLLLNNDIEITSERWLEQLVGTMELNESIAIVGCQLLFPNNTIQHGGMILGLYGGVGHANKFLYNQLSGYLSRIPALQEFSCLTAALALVRRSSFLEAGGFNAERYPTSYNDVDLCLRLRQKGYRCIYNPMVRAIHYETKTRFVSSRQETTYLKCFVEDYADLVKNDPFYNPNLSLQNEQFCGYRPFPVTDQIPDLMDMPQD